MKPRILLFSHLIDEPTEDKKWKSFVYKAACFSQYITAFFAVISFMSVVMQIMNKRIIDYQIFVPVLWYFAPFILYFIMLYVAPAIFAFVVGVLLFRLFK